MLMLTLRLWMEGSVGARQSWALPLISASIQDQKGANRKLTDVLHIQPPVSQALRRSHDSIQAVCSQLAHRSPSISFCHRLPVVQTTLSALLSTCKIRFAIKIPRIDSSLPVCPLLL